MSVRRCWRWTVASSVSLATSMRIVRPAGPLATSKANRGEGDTDGLRVQRVATFGAVTAADDSLGVSVRRDELGPGAGSEQRN